MQCSELGPFWVKEFTKELLRKRNASFNMAQKCTPGGQYRQQIQMAVKQMDTALAAPMLLAALEAMLEFTAENNANQGMGNDHPAIDQAVAAIALATGAK